MAEKTTIARPYAKAAFGIAHGEKRLAEWSAALAILARIVATPEIAGLLSSPHVSPDELAELLLRLARDPKLGERLGIAWPAGADELCANFLRLLALRRRLAVLPQVSELFDRYKAEAEQSIDVELVTGSEVDERIRDRIARTLEERLGRQVHLNPRVDPSLIGGAVIRAGDLVIDGSVRGKLERLAAELSH